MWNALLDEGRIGQMLLTAWIAKESLRSLLALARTGADRNQVGHARWKFLMGRGQRHPRSPPPRHHHRPLVERDRRLPRHRPQQR
ncbi:hypothetical protein [Streptomyces sp. NPDC001978]|uniref:hypothetical protein n=1 Tax=Streptomyces sp. NPDC001978 TaxID=3364627 RepID=UPI0036A6FFEF